MINAESLKKLEPCEDRFDNYLSHYSEFEGSLKQFLGLDKISFSDKAWVYFRSIDKEKVVLVAIALAEVCLPVFEEQLPLDKRPRLAIEAAKTGEVTKEIIGDASAAYYAASAASAAWAAAANAASAARAAYYAANAAYYTATAAYAADYAADYAAIAASDAYSAAYAAAEVIDEEAVIKIMKEFV